MSTFVDLVLETSTLGSNKPVLTVSEVDEENEDEYNEAEGDGDEKEEIVKNCDGGFEPVEGDCIGKHNFENCLHAIDNKWFI